MFDPTEFHKDFPILQREIHGKRLVYLDNAATSQKPMAVIDAISNYYMNHNANVHRGVHQLGDESTQLFHTSRQKIAEFLGADKEELVITRNTTEAVNFIAAAWGKRQISSHDVILLTEMEHHSNIVPWQMVAKEIGARIEYVAVTADGRLDMADFAKKVEKLPVKLLGVTHVSNTLGTLNPVAEMAATLRAKHPSARVIVDGAQAAAHLQTNFHQLGVDFYVISAHKMLGPMGIGAVLVKKDVLETLPPFLYGGGMINEVTTQETTFAEDLEERFTAGTPDVASLVGWTVACEYLKMAGWHEMVKHDRDLVTYTLEQLKAFPQVKIIGPLPPNAAGVFDRVGSVAFVYDGVHAHDVGQVLDSEGVAVRSGHHCTMPLHTKFEWQASTRVSFQLYNTREDVDVFIEALKKVGQVFGK